MQSWTSSLAILEGDVFFSHLPLKNFMPSRHRNTRVKRRKSTRRSRQSVRRYRAAGRKGTRKQCRVVLEIEVEYDNANMSITFKYLRGVVNVEQACFILINGNPSPTLHPPYEHKSFQLRIFPDNANNFIETLRKIIHKTQPDLKVLRNRGKNVLVRRTVIQYELSSSSQARQRLRL